MKKVKDLRDLMKYTMIKYLTENPGPIYSTFDYFNSTWHKFLTAVIEQNAIHLFKLHNTYNSRLTFWKISIVIDKCANVS